MRPSKTTASPARKGSLRTFRTSRPEPSGAATREALPKPPRSGEGQRRRNGRAKARAAGRPRPQPRQEGEERDRDRDLGEFHAEVEGEERGGEASARERPGVFEGRSETEAVHQTEAEAQEPPAGGRIPPEEVLEADVDHRSRNQRL